MLPALPPFDVLYNALLSRDESYQGRAHVCVTTTRVFCRPTAARAVAQANAANPFAIITPCHRLIGTDGNLTGYGGGLWRKQWLLDHERNHTQTHGASP